MFSLNIEGFPSDIKKIPSKFSKYANTGGISLFSLEISLFFPKSLNSGVIYEDLPVFISNQPSFGHFQHEYQVFYLFSSDIWGFPWVSTRIPRCPGAFTLYPKKILQKPEDQLILTLKLGILAPNRPNIPTFYYNLALLVPFKGLTRPFATEFKISFQRSAGAGGPQDSPIYLFVSMLNFFCSERNDSFIF